MKNIKISIREVMCDIKDHNDILYISDADCNRVLYPKTKRLSRGKKLTKESLCNTEERKKMIKINGVMFYPLDTKHVDDCYHNNITI
jgi:hypothetical protein